MIKATPHHGRQANFGRPRIWHRERVLKALRLFYLQTGRAPASDKLYMKLLKPMRRGASGPFPGTAPIHQYWHTIREAWDELGILVDQHEFQWSDLEDWYLREAWGLLPSSVIAADLQRSTEGVKMRAYRLCLSARAGRGWTIREVARALGGSVNTQTCRLRRWIGDGLVPCTGWASFRFIQPGDLANVPDIDLSRAEPWLYWAVLRGHRARLLGILEARGHGQQR